jgi:hypothetical protein
MYEYHDTDTPIDGYRGMNNTYKAIKSCCSYSNMKQEIEEYVRKCRSCQVNKVLIGKKRAPMEITSRAEHSFA